MSDAAQVAIDSQELRVQRIEPSKGWVSLRLGELWEYRELLYFLTWRDIKIRYKQTVLGAAWAVIQPVLTVLVFSIFFGRLGKIPSDGIPYPLFSFAGLVPWTLFVYGLAQSSNSLVGSQNLIKKVYFPRLTIPIASLLAGIVDFLIALLILGIMMVYYGVTPSVQILWLPLFFLLTLVTSLGVGFWLSALNVEYRDVRFAVPFLTQFWMYATPIAYPSSMLPEPWRTLYGLNPMAGVIEGFRWSLTGHGDPPGRMFLASTGAVIVVLLGGIAYFQKMETTVADVV